MANIRLDLDHEIIDGQPVTFAAPCDCTAITGLKVYHPGGSKVFVFKDAHGNTLTGIGNLFAKGAYVKAVLDVNNGFAYIQNADTNAYLEAQLASKAALGHTHSLGMNPIASTEEDTVANWVAKGNGFAYFNKFVLNNQPTQRGFLVNKVYDVTIHQEWHTIEQHSKVYVRAGQGSAWVGGSVWEHGQTDYVTATGTSGVWSYWKFSSGLCIAMGQPTVAWSAQETVITGQARSVANLDLTGIFTAVMGGTCSNVHRYVNCFVVPSGSTTAQLWATTAANPTNAHSGLFSNTPMVVLFGKWK